jgi:hypothetical protein
MIHVHVCARTNITQMVTVMGDPLIAKLEGPSGDVRNNVSITYSAAASLDPSDPSNGLEPMR